MEPSDRTFPPGVKAVYEAIEYDVIRLHFRYKLFKQLYGSKESVDALNVTAPELFAEIREIMLENVMMFISQLTDQATSKGPKGSVRENMTIGRLVGCIEAEEQGLADRLGLLKLLSGLDGHAGPIREVRNRTLAHNDWGRRNVPLPPVMKEQIDGSVEVMERILKITSMHFRDIDIGCEPFTHSDGDALVEVLGEWEAFSRESEPGRWQSQREGA